MSREVPDAWRRFCSGSIFHANLASSLHIHGMAVSSQQLQTLCEQTKLSEWATIYAKNFLVIIKNSNPSEILARVLSRSIFRRHVSENPCKESLARWLGRHLSHFLDIDHSGDIPKIPISMLTVASGEYHSNICVFYVDLPHWLPPGDLFRLRPGLFRNL